MVIRYKMFPYPVLTEFTDDYVNSKFEVTIEEAQHGYDRCLYFNVTLKNDTLQQLIKDGKASYAYHLECSQTGYRKAIQTKDKMSEIVISHKDVCGELQICPFIVATEDIHNFSSSSFHPDYAGMSIDVEAGCVLAIANPRKINIIKEIDDLSKIPSIFSIVPIYDQTVTFMRVELSQSRIIIELPQADFNTYGLIDTGMMMSDTLNAMVVVPALIYALDQVRKTPANERYAFEEEGKVWYIILKKVLSEKFGIDIGSTEFDDANTVELAQRLVEEPLHRSLETIATIGAGMNGDDNG